MVESLLRSAIDLTERGRLPDILLRAGIRQVCRQRLAEERRAHASGVNHRQAFLEEMSNSPIALVPDAANDQHYEAPVELFERALGPRLKYSSGHWPDGVTTLAGAEEAALEATAEHARLADGQDVLELGCGWGSLTLWMAERYPSSRILAVSNSSRQRRFILQRANDRGLSNVEIATADMNVFAPARQFDRVVSVEMFEHMRNYAALLQRISGWLRQDGKLFVHIFCHRTYAYPYVTEGAGNWLAQYFFTGGMMPAESLLLEMRTDLRVVDQWRWDGTHYEKTANAWLANLDAHRDDLLPVFERHYGVKDAARWFGRWRMFFMACAELFGYRQGREWRVAHYLLELAAARARVVA
jgi:cyclopropane-fatty-acyl-phospholipid synthase